MRELIYKLPEMFFGENLPECEIYFYQTNKSSEKNKVIFNQNLLCFLLDGQKEVINSTSKITVKGEEFFLLQSGQTLMTEKVTSNNTYQSILLFFSDNFFLDLALKNYSTEAGVGMDGGVILLQNDDYTLNFQESLLLIKEILFKNKALVKAKIKEILSYLFSKDPVLLNQFMYNVIRKNKDISFRQIIESQINNNLTIGELSFLCNMSLSTFKRKFAEVFHLTPKQYFISQKMKLAATLLQLNKRPSEIYYELGYEYLSAFSSEFKKHFGVSPKQFVQQSFQRSLAE